MSRIMKTSILEHPKVHRTLRKLYKRKIRNTYTMSITTPSVSPQAIQQPAPATSPPVASPAAIPPTSPNPGQPAPTSNQQKTAEVPILVKILAILQILTSAAVTVGGVVLIVLGVLTLDPTSVQAQNSAVLDVMTQAYPSITDYLGITLMIAGVAVFALGILGMFIAYGLWKGKNWARILAIIFMFLGVISNIVAMTQGSYISPAIGIIVDLAIISYLMFSSSVKAAFTAPKKKLV